MKHTRVPDVVVALTSARILERHVCHTARLFSNHSPPTCLSLFPDEQKRKKSLRRKLDSLSKEKTKDKGKTMAWLSTC